MVRVEVNDEVIFEERSRPKSLNEAYEELLGADFGKGPEAGYWWMSWDIETPQNPTVGERLRRAAATLRGERDREGYTAYAWRGEPVTQEEFARRAGEGAVADGDYTVVANAPPYTLADITRATQPMWRAQAPAGGRPFTGDSLAALVRAFYAPALREQIERTTPLLSYLAAEEAEDS